MPLLRRRARCIRAGLIEPPLDEITGRELHGQTNAVRSEEVVAQAERGIGPYENRIECPEPVGAHAANDPIVQIPLTNFSTARCGLDACTAHARLPKRLGQA